MNPVKETFATIAIGDQIRFTPQSSKRWWTVKARDERYLVAVRQAPFRPKGELIYTVVDLDSTTTHNAQPGVTRSSLNTIGGGWEIGTEGENCHEVLAALYDGWELSHRRIVQVWTVERKDTLK